MFEKLWKRNAQSVITNSTSPVTNESAPQTNIVDTSEHVRATEARRRMEEILTQPLTAEAIAKNLHFIISCTDDERVNLKLNLKGVRALINRLSSLGYTSDSSAFKAYQASQHASSYSAEGAINSFRSHCEAIIAKMPSNAQDDAVVNLKRSEIILEYKR